MSTVTSVSSTNDLANTIIANYDKDGNGSLNGTEFASFLSSLMTSLSSARSDSAPTGSAGLLSTLYPSATAAAATPAATTPAATTAGERSKVGEMLGFSADKLGNASHATFKYQIGRILQYYPSTPSGLKDALAEIQQLVPGAKIVGTNGDKIDFGSYADAKSGTIGVVDVLVGAASGGRGWAWQPVA